MLALLIGCFFVLAGLFALGAIAETTRHHAGAWDCLAAERRMMLAKERLAIERLALDDAVAQRLPASDPFPRTINARRVAEPAGPVSYQRRFMPRSEWTPLRPVRRAAA